MPSANAAAGRTDREPWTARLKDVGFWAEWAALVGLVVLVDRLQRAEPDVPEPRATSSRCCVAAAILIVLASARPS